MTTGTGGMIVTDDGELARYARSVRFHGAGGGLCDIVNIGNDWFMDEVHSAMGLNQLDNLSYFLSRRRAIADRYDDLLKTTVLIRKYAVPRSSESAFYKYPVQVIANIDVQKMRRGFQKRYGFELETIYWPLCHMQPIYRKIFGYGLGRFPVAESVLSRQVALPINAFMTLRDAEYAFKCVVSEIGAGLAAP
jgi:dTDP-4-amino-4,6-dideoxygalactose transaminase